MAKVYGRRPVMHVDGKFYMCELAEDSVYRIPPDDVAEEGYESFEACVWSYIEYLVQTAKKIPLVAVDNTIQPMIPGIADMVATEATHFLRIEHGSTHFIDEENYDPEMIVRTIAEDPGNIIF